MRSALALVLSLTLTGVLLAMNYALFSRHGGLPGLGDERKVTVTAKRVIRQIALPPVPVLATNAPPFRWNSLESPDYVLYAANLRAVGCPERTLRDILLPDIEKLYDERERQLEGEPGDHFWETADQRDARQRQREVKHRELELEKRALIRQLLGADWSFAALKELRSDGFATALIEILLGFTDTAKSDYLFTTHQLTEDDVKAFQSATEGIYLDEDLPKLQALRDRFEADLARGLAPAEIEELRLRLAAVGNEGLEHLRRRDGVTVSGAELREIARLRAETKDMLAKALNLEDELYSEELRAKADTAFAELLRRFLGTERSADAERAKDDLFRELLQSTENRGVGKAALVQAYESRRAAEKQARDIRADQQLSTEERTVLLATLRAQTAQALSRTLGPVGFDAYLKQHGQQFTNSLSLPAVRVRAGVQPPEGVSVK